jgi:hypothetical protein
MQKLTAIVAIAAIVAAGFQPASAIEQSPVVPAVTTSGASADEVALIPTTIDAFPNGGEPLKLAISDLIVKHPNLAAALAAELKNNPELTQAQREAIFAGLSDALNKLGIVAQAGTDLDPLLIALLVAGLGAAGFGVYELTKKTGDCTVSCN